ncbi:MAG TPA: serine hydrolase domain-containing protein [Thermoanaerobaculia bacterium]|nr:serine hydrolase domain-containing protein [Thermoanaerobaculia bacterium]
MEQILERIRTKYRLPGLAATVITGDKAVRNGVAGVRRQGAPDKIEPADRFHIASCTKSMTATLAAIAVHKGQLEWTTSLSDALPSLAAKIRPEYRSATLEALLAHRARMPAYTQPNQKQVEQMKALKGSPAEQRLAFLAEALSTEEPNPGSGNDAYSNVGYAAAGAMIERAAGASWEELLRRELAQPLGMKNMGFGYPATASAPNQPRGHSESDGSIVELPLDESRQLAVCLWPAGAVHCSIGDLGLYVADHLNGLRGRRSLLPQAIYQRLHHPPGGGDSGFTLGWGIRPDQRWGVTHFGAGSGGWFFVRILIVPVHDAAVVAASNSGQAGDATRELCMELLEKFA